MINRLSVVEYLIVEGIRSVSVVLTEFIRKFVYGRYSFYLIEAAGRVVGKQFHLQYFAIYIGEVWYICPQTPVEIVVVGYHCPKEVEYGVRHKPVFS